MTYTNRFVLIVTWLFLAGCSGRDKSAKNTPDPPASARQPTPEQTMQPPSPQAETAGKAAGTVSGADRWRYERTADQDGQPVYKASVMSPQRLEFEFPYNGGSTATLTIRKRKSGTNVYIQVSKGQFNRSFQGGSARVRFDQNPPIDYTFSAAANGSANVIFFDADRALIDQVKRSRTMLVDVEFAGQDKRQIMFRTSGLEWNH